MSTVATIHSEALDESQRRRAQLVVVEGPDAGRAVSLDGPCVVGTDAGCELVLSDERVSRRHVSVAPGAAGFVVEDLESRNGTFFEGSRLSRGELSVGATLAVGRSFVRIAPRPEPLEVPPSQRRRFGELVGESLAMREVFAVLELAARSDATVLLEGETGVGKELAARALHDQSARRQAPFVALDVSSLPESLVESALFGHARGAFTGAAETRAGAFVRAHEGTLFLDELDSAPAAVQTRLLRAIEAREVRPVGSDDARPVDVRLVAASRQDLAARVATGGLRADLFYRLSVLRIRIPPLRERREDLAPIAAEVLRRRGLADAGAIGGPGLDRLLAHDWPGNARELRNVLDRALVMSPGARSFAELRIALDGEPGPHELSVRADLPYHEAKAALLAVFERRYVRDLLARHDGNLSAAARDAGVDRKSLRALVTKHSL